MTPELIERFLTAQVERGRGEGTVQSYRGILTALYHSLPEGKRLTARTGDEWHSRLEEQGLAPRTVNARISVWNSFVQYLGRREWQVERFYRQVSAPRPELTREEYLRLLSAARLLEREKSYLVIKTLGSAGLRAQELSQLTVEAVEQGDVQVDNYNHRQTRLVHLPGILREELMDYARRTGIRSGPVFLNQNGDPMGRVMAHRHVSSVSGTARVAEEKANPRCLWQMYESTQANIRANAALLFDRAYEQILENEQRSMGRACAGG